MKKNRSGLSLILLSSFLCLVALACQRSAPDILDGRIVFLGDSITQDGRYVSVFEYELFKRYPQVDIDVISVGLSSETVSGLTEPDHPYPRPNAHERLGRMLAALKPATVIACYGMNDGIYHPQDDARFQAYKDGMLRLIATVRAAGARVILLTPPIFDAAVIPEKVVDHDAEKFGYATPYRGYNDVLADYAEWLLLDVKDVKVIDLNGPMLTYTEEQRAIDPTFSLCGDGVHPGLVGHAFMAQRLLEGIRVRLEEMDPQEYARHLEKDELYKMVDGRRAMRSMAWLVDIGFDMPGDYASPPVQEAETEAAAIKEAILRLVRK